MQDMVYIEKRGDVRAPVVLREDPSLRMRRMLEYFII